MPNDLILLTGATGHLGFRVLEQALEAGYHVRAAVRNEDKAAQLSNNRIIKALNASDRLSFVYVADLELDGAYNEAVKGVKYIIHVASPIPHLTKVSKDISQDVADADYINPAVKGTIGMLEAAKNHGPTVQRIVITSSIAALTSRAVLAAPSSTIITGDSRTEDIYAPYSDTMSAYGASKIRALNAAEAWIKSRETHFDVIHIHPSYILGRDDMVTNLDDFKRGTNLLALGIALGSKNDTPRGCSVVHVDDCARSHLLALKPGVKGNQSFIANITTPANWDEAVEVVKDDFPEALEKGIFRADGHQAGFVSPFDAVKTEQQLGMKFSTYKEQVKSVLQHYVELKTATAA